MARKKLGMRKIKEVFRLVEAGLGKSQIKQATGVSRKTIREYVQRSQSAGLSFADCQALEESELIQRLYPEEGKSAPPAPNVANWEWVHQEMKRKSVTLRLLWEELKEKNAQLCGYSQFCRHYGTWKQTMDLPMRQDHKAGEKVFVDYAGQTVPITDSKTGEIRQAQVFVATLGASNYSYAEASWGQTLPEWLSSHCRMFEYLGGVTELVIPDNLKSEVQKPCRYEPENNPSYQEWAIHYGVAVMPARVRHPQDKGKVENGVQLVERWILAALRNHTFFSLGELNSHLQFLLEKLNQKPFQKLEGTRKSVFEMVDKPALRALPESRYEYAEWKKATVNIDYHVEVDGHYYSVPYRFVKQKVELRITLTTVTIMKDSKQIAAHARSIHKGKHSTVREHMPKNHQEYGDWSPSRILSWGNSLGASCGQVIQKVIEAKDHPVKGYRAALGIIRLEKPYGKARLEAACQRACDCQAYSYHSIKSILEKGLDQKPAEEAPERGLPQDHENLRAVSEFAPLELAPESLSALAVALPSSGVQIDSTIQSFPVLGSSVLKGVLSYVH